MTNDSPANIKSLKTQLSKVVQLGWILPLTFIVPVFKIELKIVNPKESTLARGVSKKKMDQTICEQWNRWA